MTNFYKKLIILLLSTLLPNMVYAADSVSDAKEFMRLTSERVINLAKHKELPIKTEHTLENIFEEVVDIDWIGKFVIGRKWQSLNESQKINYLKMYKKFLISQYLPLFKDYSGQEIDIKSAKTLSDNRYLVTTEIKSSENNSKYKVEYILILNNNKFKIRDILAQDVSMLATQRSQLSSIVNNQGYNDLIDQLSKKSAIVDND